MDLLQSFLDFVVGDEDGHLILARSQHRAIDARIGISGCIQHLHLVRQSHCLHRTRARGHSDWKMCLQLVNDTADGKG